MTETAARIRWEPAAGGGAFGYVGTRGTALFKVWQPREGIGTAQPWAIKSDWMAGYATGAAPDTLKAEAERWLEEFTSSLGAVFPEPELPECRCTLSVECPACRAARETPAPRAGEKESSGE